MKKYLLSLLALLTVTLLAVGRYVSPSADDLVPTAERVSGNEPGDNPSVLYTGGTCTTTTVLGPTSSGTTGSIRCLFAAGSPTPATLWWVDSATKPGIPSLIHSVGGGAVSGFSQTSHTVYFEVAAPHTKPPNKAVSVVDDKTINVHVPYN